jgi:hypothetical protein
MSMQMAGILLFGLIFPGKKASPAMITGGNASVRKRHSCKADATCDLAIRRHIFA